MKFELSLQRTRQVHVSDIICSSYFCGYALRLYCKDIRAIDSHGLLQLCNNLDLAVREEIAFPILQALFHTMPSPMKLDQKRSTVTSTSTHGGAKSAISSSVPFNSWEEYSDFLKRTCQNEMWIRE